MSARRMLGFLVLFAAWSCAADEPGYAGSSRCAQCHAEQAAAWRHSDHALAMQTAGTSTVLGDFTDVAIEIAGDRARFMHRDGGHHVVTTGPDGAPAELEITHTFGVQPLQQYLVPLAGGRLQALPWAWDSRPAAEGGGRWFHLYAGDPPAPGDPLHWSGREQNWNHMCAACHVTGFRKRYDPGARAYDSREVELGVGCEGCHGPGGRHAASAAAGDPAPLPVPLAPRPPGTWRIDPGTGNAAPLAHRADAEIELCARCHARRRTIAETPPGTAFLDAYVPVLIEPGYYHADGQIRAEVFEYGSFLQSRMYGAGVACSDCHEPHGLRLRAQGDGLCLRCHAEDRYARRTHHLHPRDSAGARCVACHMPARTYMRVDDRRDHGLRAPRPDLSVRLGVPNVCNDCHSDRDAQWAAARLAERHGPPADADDHFAVALAAGWRYAAGARAKLAGLAEDTARPAIVRASALAALAALPGPTAAGTAVAALDDPEPLVRLGALRALAPYPATDLVPLLAPLLADPLRALRIEAAHLLAAAPVPPPALERALAELEGARGLNADRPEAWLERGTVARARGDAERAAAAFAEALTIAPDFIPARVNLADLYRARGRDADGERLLRVGLAARPDAAALHHALGLLLVRTGRREAGIAALAEGARLAPDDPQLAYLHGVAVNDAAGPHAAIAVLEQAHDRFPADLEILYVLATISRDAGAHDDARRWALEMLAEEPGDRRARRLLASIGTATPRGTGR